MAYALVGTIGVATQGTSGAAVTPAYGQSPTAGNLLICFCTVTGSATSPTTPSGWSIASDQVGTSCSGRLFYKVAAGSDATPTIAAITSGLIAAQLAEFSGNSATPLDNWGESPGITSPISIGLNLNGFGTEFAAGELVIMGGGDFRSVARTTNDTWTSNHGTVIPAGNNNGVSSTNHYSFGYYLSTSSNSTTTTVTQTLSVTTSITGVITLGASFLLAPIPVLPELIMQPLTPGRV